MFSPAAPQAVPPIFSAFGVAMVLHAIATRGGLVAGDVHAIEAASALIFRAVKEGRL